MMFLWSSEKYLFDNITIYEVFRYRVSVIETKIAEVLKERMIIPTSTESGYFLSSIFRSKRMSVTE